MSFDEEDDVTPRNSKRQRRQQDHIKKTAPNHACYFDGKKLALVINTKSVLVRHMDARNLLEHIANALQVFGYVKTILYNIELRFRQFLNHHNLLRLVQKAPKTVLVIVLLCSKIDMLMKNLFIQCHS
jgi:hypothetical protein